MLLTDRDIDQESDLYTDDIFNIPQAHMVKGKVSRLVSDYNRAPDHIEMEHKLAHDGVVVSVNEDSKQIYQTPPSIDEIMRRIEKYHQPFHNKIEELKPEVRFIIDGHSLRSVGPSAKDDAGKERADIVLGNRDYTTCSRAITHRIAHFFIDRGFSVKINDPYGGKYIIGHHCSRAGLNGLQVEVNKKLYMNEKTLKPYTKKIAALNQHMIDLAHLIAKEIVSSDLKK